MSIYSRSYRRKGDFILGPLLEQQFIGALIKNENTKGTMQNTGGLLQIEFMRGAFGFGSNDDVVFAEN